MLWQVSAIPKGVRYCRPQNSIEKQKKGGIHGIELEWF
jgi:hypothetical protein